jgi:hypothetical protein
VADPSGASIAIGLTKSDQATGRPGDYSIASFIFLMIRYAIAYDLIRYAFMKKECEGKRMEL